MYYLICILIFLVLCIVLFFKKSHNYWELRNIPFIKPSIPFGNVGPLILGKESLGVTIANAYRELKQTGAGFGGIYIFHKPAFIPVDPELVKRILITDFNYFEDRGTYYDEKVDPISGHLFAVRNPKWNKLRKKFTPLFTQMRLKSMFPLVIRCSQELNTLMEIPSKTGESLDMKDIVARYNTDVISSCAFGLECNSLHNPNTELRNVGRSFFNDSMRNSLVISCALIAPVVLKTFKIPVCDPSAAKHFLDVMKYTVDARENNNITRNDMLDLLIKLKNNETIDNEEVDKKNSNFKIDFIDLAAQSFIFFLAGHETSSSVMNFALYELTQNQNIQDKLRDEIRRVLKKHGNEITYDAVMEMNYLEQVIKECLRKYPPISFLNRECTKNYIIPGTNTTIEKGTTVVISSLGIHRDPEFFENPEHFDPERFNAERKDCNNENCFMPFGAGPRNCIGLRFGMVQTKVGLISLLKDYKFTLDPKTKYPPTFNKKSIILAFADKMWMKPIKA